MCRANAALVVGCRSDGAVDNQSKYSICGFVSTASSLINIGGFRNPLGRVLCENDSQVTNGGECRGGRVKTSPSDVSNTAGVDHTRRRKRSECVRVESVERMGRSASQMARCLLPIVRVA